MGLNFLCTLCLFTQEKFIQDLNFSWHLTEIQEYFPGALIVYDISHTDAHPITQRARFLRYPWNYKNLMCVYRSLDSWNGGCPLMQSSKSTQGRLKCFIHWDFSYVICLPFRQQCKKLRNSNIWAKPLQCRYTINRARQKKIENGAHMLSLSIICFPKICFP